MHFPILILDSYTWLGVQLELEAAENTKNGNYRPKEIETAKRLLNESAT